MVSGWLRSLTIESAWDRLPPNGYFGRLPRSPALTQMISDSIMALRLADVDAAAIDESQVQSPAKLADLQVCFQAYSEFLRENQLVDEADAYKLGVERLADPRGQIDATAIVLIPERLHAEGLQRDFLDALPSSRCFHLEDDQLNWPSAAAKPMIPESLDVQFFRAVGDVNEVREVLRRCLKDRTAFDDVEVLVTHSESLIPLFYTTGFRYGETDAPLPMTFAEGLPASISRPGRALLGWLAWIAAGYPQQMLANLIGDGLFTIPGSPELGATYCSRLLRQLSIGQGENNYLGKIDGPIQAIKKQLTRAEKESDEERSAEISADVLQRKLRGLQTLRKLVAQLLKLAAHIEQNEGEAVLLSAQSFLTKAVRCVDALDWRAAENLLEKVVERRDWFHRLKMSPDSADWLKSLAQQTRILESGPQPGHLHVANVRNGGRSGRSQTFVIGMDDRRFPGALMQDAVLLDHERTSISPDLELSGQRLQSKVDDFHRMLARLSGRVTLSWSSHDLMDDRPRFPSPQLLTLFRTQSGDAKADGEQLCLAAGTPVSFAPDEPCKALDDAEQWLWMLGQDERQSEKQLASVQSHFPNLAAGREARTLRGLGPNNGLVPQAGRDLDPFQPSPPIYSASALEHYGRCPLAFFFRQGLKLFAPDEVELDPDQWLDARQAGLLLHDVFRQFMSELAEANRRPDFERDHKRLASILGQSAEDMRILAPPPNESSYRSQYWQLIGIARIFLLDEQEHCLNSQPRFFEVACGLPPNESPSGLDDPHAVVVPLTEGKRMLARGQVDRVDEVGDRRYAIWDYKTGSGYGYDAADPFRGGRRVQSVLYLAMIQAALQKKFDPSVVVERFGYFFPSLRARGLRIDWSAEQLQQGVSILDRMGSSIADGVFLATDDNKLDCGFCDYREICGDVEAIGAHSKRLLDADDLPLLNNLRGLRRG
jgi:ATP-dependent helicase/nuclease subunit B